MDLDALVLKNHLLRKIERVMTTTGCASVCRRITAGIPTLWQTCQRIQDSNSYRRFPGYSLLDNIPHFATASYAFCKRFPEELSEEVFEHILNKAISNRMADQSEIFIDGTHSKACANKKKFQKEQVKKTARVHTGQLRREMNTERKKFGKKPIEDDDPSGRESEEKTVSTTGPDCGMFIKSKHEKQFAYEVHTACDSKGFVLGVEMAAGNTHDSVAWGKIYDDVTSKYDIEFAAMDAGYKMPCNNSVFHPLLRIFPAFYSNTPVFAS